MMAYFGALTGVLLFVVVRGCVASTSADADQKPVQSSRRLALVAEQGAEESGVHHPPPKTETAIARLEQQRADQCEHGGPETGEIKRHVTVRHHDAPRGVGF